MDGQFEPLRADLADMGIELNVVLNDKHIPEIVRQICMVKEHAWATYCMLPIKHMPCRLIIKMVYAANYWLNIFPCHDGFLTTLRL